MSDPCSRHGGRMRDPGGGGFVVDADPRLAGLVRGLAGRRMVFFAGLPGTGKSLLVHQLTHTARAAGRTVHLLQWDVARPLFEASADGRRYPIVDGVTHPLVRKAAGLWVRDALAAWSARHPEPAHLLVGEAPLVGGRFIELARAIDDPAEPLLTGPGCRFVITVPSREVRGFLEAERARRAARPLHPREREDAPPSVLRDLWRELADVSRALGEAGAGPETTYAPDVYARTYARILRHRPVEILPLDAILPTERLSVYDFPDPPADLVPTGAEATTFIRAAETRYPDLGSLEREIERWWQT
jgi:hypothetical protein